MIGARSLSSLALLAFALISALALGSFAPERMHTRGFGTYLAIGMFGIVVGTLMFRFFRLGERSRHYVRWATERSGWDVTEGHFVGGDTRRFVLGESRENEAFDLPSWLRLAMSITVTSVLALAVIDGRALARLSRASGDVTSMASTYCPDELPPPPPARVVNEPGCELVRRAYALGYTKTLGDCAPKTEHTAQSARPICTRRQRDEPWLHYSYRLFTSSLGGVVGATKASYFTKARDDFQARAKHIGALRSSEIEMLTSSPHASHHLYTNLPDPKNGAFEETTCTSRYARLPHRATPPKGPLQASLVLEQVVAQLLFEGTYDASAGHCREYHVHWGAPADACKQIAANPAEFLKRDGALNDVRRTLDRFRVANELTALGEPKPTLEPPAFVSFQCYIEGDASPRARTPFTLDGQAFTADELHVSPSPEGAELYIDRYDALARLFAKTFHYGYLMSEAGAAELAGGGATKELEASLAGADYLLTRLYELESIDIYLDPGWLAYRPDLLEVYPYERHLKNFIEVFRRDYRRERGRL